MDGLDKACSSLVDKCKIEAKQLVEFTATRRKVHWTHPSFISFCVSVEDILSYEVKRRFRANKSKAVTPSGKILRELGKLFPEALEIYDKCFNSSHGDKEDYTILQTSSPAERRVLWLRVALVEGKLAAIVENIMTHPKLYYGDKSVLCHPVYGEVFQSLIDGPCSIRFSRLKVSEAVSGMPSPAELVNRHKKVLSISASRSDKTSVAMPTEKAWDHVQSLYQTNSSVCLFGKNNVLVNPAGLTNPLRGYLTLQLSTTTLTLKWIPNTLLKDSSNARSGLWSHVIAVDVTRDIAHIHCHRAQGCSAEMILIGYDGIAHPPLLFPHQPSLFMFLECLENSLLPKGCLEPPLWYLKQTSKTQNKASTHNDDEDDEWFNDMEVWNQVFRIRYGGRISSHDLPEPVSHDNAPPPSLFPLNLAPYTYTRDGYETSSESSISSEEEELVAMEKPGCLARKDWEIFQSEVSKQLLARYFYSWLSYCRHMTKVRQSVAHMVNTVSQVDDVIDRESPLSEKEWIEFCDLPSAKREERWSGLLRIIYMRGMQHSIRSEVWPFLLGVYPVSSTPQERADVLTQITKVYSDLLVDWKRAEVTHRELTTVDSSRGSSPSLSSVSPSPTLSPAHHGNRKEVASDSSEEEATPTPSQWEGPEDTTPSPNELDSKSDVTELVQDDKEDDKVIENGLSNGQDNVTSCAIPPMSCDFIRPMGELDAKGMLFIQELYNIDKDIPRCDRDYWYFKLPGNLLKVRNIVCSYVWANLGEGYSQGMCDLLAPILVATDNEPLTFACYLKVMERSSKLFPPSTGMNTRLANLQSLLQVMEPDYYQYLTERPMGDGFFYCYRWLLVSFKREFCYSDMFRIWETIWTARQTVSNNFEEFLALAIMKQFQSAIMDAHLDPSDILNLFTDLADKHAIDCSETIRTAILTVSKLQDDLSLK